MRMSTYRQAWVNEAMTHSCNWSDIRHKSRGSKPLHMQVSAKQEVVCASFVVVQTSAEASFQVVQPGSSVATALSEGESKKKHVMILEVKGQQFRVSKHALQTVRPFVFDAVSVCFRSRSLC